MKNIKKELNKTLSENDQSQVTKTYNKNRFVGRRFLVTIHGQNQQDYQNLKRWFQTSEVFLACMAKEFGKHRIHPHWQIYFELTNSVQNIKELLEKVLGHNEAHIEKANGTSNENIRYVYAMNKPYEIGMVCLRKNVTPPRDFKGEETIKFWLNFKPRNFQQDIIDIALGSPDRRTIYWFYDPEGNSGKTILTEYLTLFHGAIVTGLKPNDMKHAIVRYQEITKHSPTIICLNMARSAKFNQMAAIGIEEIKDGVFFSGKYDSASYVAANKAHVFVFSNEDPKPYKRFFSSDRWKVFRIRNAELFSED